MRCTLIIVVVLMSFLSSARAMELIKLTCTGCQFERKTAIGATKQGFLRDGLNSAIFFCSTSKEFLEFQVVGDEKIFKKARPADGANKNAVEIAKETDLPVAAGSKFHLFTHPRCPHELIPLDFYRSQTNPICPICDKGELAIESLRFVD